MWYIKATWELHVCYYSVGLCRQLIVEDQLSDVTAPAADSRCPALLRSFLHRLIHEYFDSSSVLSTDIETCWFFRIMYRTCESENVTAKGFSYFLFPKFISLYILLNNNISCQCLKHVVLLKDCDAQWLKAYAQWCYYVCGSRRQEIKRRPCPSPPFPFLSCQLPLLFPPFASLTPPLPLEVGPLKYS